MTSLNNLTIKSFHEGLIDKKFSALEVTQEYFKRIKLHDSKIGAYLSTFEENAVKTAERTDIAIAENKPVSELSGVPLAVKDLILIKDELATAASKILEDYRASYDAHVIKKLKSENVVFLGKTNLDEFAMGSSTENSGFHLTKNPHDESRVPGGSSGGSTAAVAANMALAALGTDTGGSIRQPAALCGVVGLKTTYGAVSRSGVIAMASSLDQVGPIAKTVEDVAILFKGITGHDPMDSTSAEIVSSDKYENEILHPDLNKIKNLNIGIPDEYFGDGLSQEVAAAVDSAIQALKSLGLKFHKISLPHTKYALSTYYIIMPAEVSSNLARYDGVRYSRMSDVGHKMLDLKDIYWKQRGLGFGPESKRRIILGTFVLSSGYYDAYYDKAQRVRTLIKKDFEEAFKKVDVILTPVTPTSAFKIGEKTDNPLQMYLSDIFTIPVNLAGLPAISIPVRQSSIDQKTSNILPIGFQLIGRYFREADILGLGTLYQKN
jgi:aspartyl-tRNA(Asn)/glutamyl-tRNA(Gln) amidotransferase subunit A